MFAERPGVSVGRNRVEFETAELALNGSLLALYRRLAEACGERPLKLQTWLEIAETWCITHALQECRGNRSAAARALGIGRRTLYAKMARLGIRPSWGAAPVPHSERML